MGVVRGVIGIGDQGGSGAWGHGDRGSGGGGSGAWGHWDRGQGGSGAWDHWGRGEVREG